MQIGWYTGSGSTLNLTGGTLVAGQVTTGGAVSSIFNFNGGTLRASAASGTLMTGLTGADVRTPAASSTTAATRSPSARPCSTAASALPTAAWFSRATARPPSRSNGYNGGTTLNNGTLAAGNVAALGTDSSP